MTKEMKKMRECEVLLQNLCDDAIDILDCLRAEATEQNIKALHEKVATIDEVYTLVKETRASLLCQHHLNRVIEND